MPKSLRTNNLLNGFFYSVGVVLFVVFFVVTVWGKDGLLHLMALKKTRDKIIASNHQLIQSNFFLLEEIQKSKEQSYIEQRARSDLGMVKDNEVVFIIR